METIHISHILLTAGPVAAAIKDSGTARIESEMR